MNRKMTFQEVYELWFITYQEGKAPISLRKTKGYIKHALDYFGHVDIAAITPKMCEELIIAKTNTGAKKRNGEKGLLSNPKHLINYSKSVFKKAIELNLITVSPMVNIFPPYEPRKKTPVVPTAYTAEDKMVSLALLEQVKETALGFKNLMHTVYFYLLIDTGMKNQEIAALTWADIDFRNKTIQIPNKLRYSDELGNYLVPSPEGKSRTLSISDETIFVLKEWKAKQKMMLRQAIKTDNLQPILNNANNEFTTINGFSKFYIELKKHKPFENVSNTVIRNTICKRHLLSGISVSKTMDLLGFVDDRIVTRINEIVQMKGDVVNV